MFNEKTWKNGEEIAAKYMLSKGYKILFRNFRCKVAELDIVAIFSKKEQKKLLKKELLLKIKNCKSYNDSKLLKIVYKNQIKQLNDLLIITEVKSRSSDKFGLGVEAISKDKIKHMKNGAEVLLKMKKFKNKGIRFDVASVDGENLTYIEDAF